MRLSPVFGMLVSMAWGLLLPCHAEDHPASPSPAPAAAVPGPTPTVRVVSPAEDEVIEASNALLTVSVENLPAVPQDVPVVRAILDNQPPLDLDDPATPLGLANLPVGGHLLRVYAIDAEGKMLGNPEAFVVRRFFVRRRDFQNVLVPGTPWLTLNNPSGTALFTGAVAAGAKTAIPQARASLDYEVQGENVGGCLIHYKLNHREATVPVGKKIAWTDLNAGRYSLMVELLAADGSPLPGVFNQVERTFDVQTPAKALSLVPVASSVAAMSAAAATASPSAGTAVKKKER